MKGTIFLFFPKLNFKRNINKFAPGGCCFFWQELPPGLIPNLELSCYHTAHCITTICVSAILPDCTLLHYVSLLYYSTAQNSTVQCHSATLHITTIYVSVILHYKSLQCHATTLHTTHYYVSVFSLRPHHSPGTYLPNPGNY